MNGSRSISMRKGYLLTALAAAVLLAASSGTAYAQGIGFVGTSQTMTEGASPDPKTAAPIMIDINVTGLTAPGDGVPGNLEDRPRSSHDRARRRRLCTPGKRRATVQQPADLVGQQEFSH